MPRRDRNSYETHAALIAALAESIEDRDWGSEVLVKCEQMEEAIEKIRRIAQLRAGGER